MKWDAFTGFTAPKLLWLQRHEPKAFEKISKIMLPKDYIAYKLTGTFATDVSDASVADETGLSTACIVAAGAGDNAAAAIGTGTIGEGGCNISLGTSGTLFISGKAFRADGSYGLHSFCHADGGYHLMGCMLSAASCNQWWSDGILKTSDYEAEQAKF